ncbi:MAG: SDR family NAD(P)-dependent oxidoreductase [Novosphingobium sp.]|nr:SDR family NAD(P)-dependent oxidoreductase [Novosphingobium sp.]
MDFATRYGPWAVIAGASEGTGREYVRQIAAQEVNCVLVARREGPLLELAEEIRAEFAVECLVVPLDLARPDAADQLIAAIGDHEVGLYIANAGADPNGSEFLDAPVEAWVGLATRNVLTTLRCCHHFGAAMKARGQGGMLLVGSGACYGGSPHLGTYAGSKAFEMCFAEGLWGELQSHGVDVLYFAMATTDTPELRRLLAHLGAPEPAVVADPAEVARVGLERLPHGPIHNWGLADDDPGWAGSSAAQRRARVQMLAQATAAMFKPKEPAA